MRILALDCATRTGWAHNCAPGYETRSGVETFRAPKDMDAAARYADFHSWVSELIDETQPALVVYEAPVEMHGSKAQRYLSIGFATRVQEAAAVRHIPYREVYPSSLKKHATGSGRASKGEMVSAARRQFALLFAPDDNEADALMLLAMALDGFPEREPARKRKGRTPAPI